MTCYKAEPVSRKQICACVRELKRQIGLEDELYFPIVEFVENILPLLVEGYQFEVAGYMRL